MPGCRQQSTLCSAVCTAQAVHTTSKIHQPPRKATGQWMEPACPCGSGALRQAGKGRLPHGWAPRPTILPGTRSRADPCCRRPSQPTPDRQHVIKVVGRAIAGAGAVGGAGTRGVAPLEGLSDQQAVRPDSSHHVQERCLSVNDDAAAAAGLASPHDTHDLQHAAGLCTGCCMASTRCSSLSNPTIATAG